MHLKETQCKHTSFCQQENSAWQLLDAWRRWRTPRCLWLLPPICAVLLSAVCLFLQDHIVFVWSPVSSLCQLDNWMQWAANFWKHPSNVASDAPLGWIKLQCFTNGNQPEGWDIIVSWALANLQACQRVKQHLSCSLSKYKSCDSCKLICIYFSIHSCAHSCFYCLQTFLPVRSFRSITFGWF